MDTIHTTLVNRVRKIDQQYRRFLDLYNEFFDIVIAGGRGKYDGNLASDIEFKIDEMVALLPRIKEVGGSVTNFRRFSKSLVRQINRLSDDPDKTQKEVISDPALRLVFTRFSEVAVNFIEKILRLAKIEYPKLGWEKRIRRFKGIPIVFFFRHGPLDEEAEGEAVAVELDIVAERRRVNEQRVEQVAANDKPPRIVQRARIFGKTVFVGMTPKDYAEYEEVVAVPKEEKRRLSQEKNKVQKDINRLKNQARKNPEDAELIKGEIFESNSILRGKKSGRWEGAVEGVYGDWEGIKESASTREIISRERVAGSAESGMWSFKGIVPGDPSKIVSVIIKEDGKVKPRRNERLPVSGRIYPNFSSGKTDQSSWMRFGGKKGDRVNFGVPLGRELGLDDEIKEVSFNIADIQSKFDRVAYDPETDMKAVPMETWVEKKRNEREKERSISVVDVDKYLAENKDLKTSDEIIDSIIDSGVTPIWRGLTDDKVKDSNAVTRLFPAVEIKGREYVADGQFKGYPVDVLVNKAGRVVGGSTYTYDGDGNLHPVEIRRSTGEMDYCIRNEIHVSVDSQGLLVVVLPTVGEKTKMKHPAFDQIVKLMKRSNTVELRPDVTRKGSHTKVFQVDPADIDDLRYNLSLTMSSEASKKMQEFYNRREIAKKSLLDSETEHITAENIPGFKATYIDDDGVERPAELRSYQKKAISYISEKGNGVIGLDTGLGKTPVMVANFLMWIDDGTLDERNGKVLMVGEASLRGNFPAEIRKFCEDPTGVVERLVVMSWDGFRETPHEELEKYGAIFFDEAQKLKNATGPGASKVGKHALRLNHPHKVLSTASVMEKSIADLYNLNAIANNDYGIDPERAESEKRDFLKQNCILSGTRPIGIKNSEGAQNRMKEWVKANFLYVDQESVKDEIGLKDITPPEEQTRQVYMEDDAIAEYEKVSGDIISTLKIMQSKYQERQTEAPDIVGLSGALKKGHVMDSIQRLRDISNDFELYQRKHMERDLAREMYNKDITKKDKLTLRQKKKINNIVDSKVSSVPNPKIDQCVAITEGSIARGKKVAVWTDQPSLAMKTAKEMSIKFPGKYIALCLNNKIEVYDSGGGVIDLPGTTDGKNCYPVDLPYAEWCTIKAIFSQRGNYKYPDGSAVPNKQWQKYVLDYVLKTNPQIGGVILTSAYSTGHNLQWMSSVIHLDRDNWNNQEMKQRTARCYRQGQKEDVECQIIDSVVENSDTPAINEVQKWMMEMEQELFDDVVRASMSYEFNENLVQFGAASEVQLRNDKPMDRSALESVLAPTSYAALDMETISDIHE